MIGRPWTISGPHGRQERQLEDVSKCAGECLRFWRQIGTGVDLRFLAVLSIELH